jgi:hypothetical protein
MPWRLIHGRARAFHVAGVADGQPSFTLEPAEALTFATQDDARDWARANLAHGRRDLALLRDGPEAHPRTGMAGHYQKK